MEGGRGRVGWYSTYFALGRIWHSLQKFRPHSEGCHTPRKICYNNFFFFYSRPKKQNYCTCVREEWSECVCVCVNVNIFCSILIHFLKFIMQKRSEISRQTFSPFKKKKKKDRRMRLAKGLSRGIRCPHVSGHKSAITSQAGYEFCCGPCVANLSAKLRSLMHCFQACYW